MTIEPNKADSLPIGAQLDNEFLKLRNLIAKLQSEADELTKSGCLNAKIHFKSDRPHVMYMLCATDAAGKRKYIHVGVDSEKQNEAIRKVSRYEQRDLILMKIGSMTDLLKDFEFRITSLHSSLSFQVKRLTGVDND